MATQEQINNPRWDGVRKVVTAENEHTWDDTWKKNVIPWDLGEVQPPLKELIDSKAIPFPDTGKAFVPGCGGGYDPIYLAGALGAGWKGVGLDISETALEVARKNLAQVQDEALVKRVEFRQESFFDLEEQFDLVYDVAFFVAIPPAWRPKWGAKMQQIVKKGGFLVTLVSPIEEFTESGPPFYVRPEHYPEVLGEGWEKIYDKTPTKMVDFLAGKQQMIVYKRL